MIRAVMLGSRDLDEAGAFYDAVLAPLGYVRLQRLETEIGYGPPHHANGDPGIPHIRLWVLLPFNGQEASFGNGVDIAFVAPSRDAVDRFYAAAMAHGGTDEGPPGLRLHYTPTFYTAYVRDPTGNKINAVYDEPAAQAPEFVRPLFS